MRARFPVKLAAAAAATALLATASACASDGGGGEEPEGTTGGTLRVFLSEPDSLMPSGANDSESNQVITEIYRGLTKNVIEGGVENIIAESIESEDNITWNIQLKEGFTFTNGEPVDADSFIRAWNYAAYGPNAQDGAGFFERIVGFGEMQADPPEAEELSGVTKVDDYSFTVELSAPFVGFPQTVAYQSFLPLAEACLADVDACNEMPISNGPYMLASAWEHDVQVALVKNPDYIGEDTVFADEIIMRIFESSDAAYAAFQGDELDVIDQIPAERLAEAEAQFADGLFQTANNSLTYLGIPFYDERFEDVRIRQAFSLAIDRQAIIDAALGGTQRAASGWVSPLFEGQRDAACTTCEYDPERAAALLEEAGGWEGELTLTANAGADHETWMQALGDQLNQNLGIEYTLDVGQQFAEYLATLENQDAVGPFRLGWGPDYALMETYLTHLYATDQSSNYGFYSNPQFDDLVAQGDSAPTEQEAIALYQQAEDILNEDMVTIPLWWGTQSVLYNPDVVAELNFNPIDYEDYGLTTMAAGG
ncbi:MAG: ABC transporter substrate-binding protein [Micromonosporaceae bacterium]|nr:ABC transporter substrate-binding protein [Micromonosporaceae bacterium]